MLCFLKNKSKIFYRFVRRFVTRFLGLFNKIKIDNKQNMPAEGGYIIACTHTGWINILNLGVSICPNPIQFMTKKQLFDYKLLGRFITKMKAFPVDRENPYPSVVKVPMNWIQEGKVIGIFQVVQGI